MNTVAVITGGAGGMGRATVPLLAPQHAVVLLDNRAERLQQAAEDFADLPVTTIECDVTDRAAVESAFDAAAEHGTVVKVVHTAGVSPSMGDAELVVRTNALGTLNVNEVFFERVGEGGAIVNVASMAAHVLPEEMVPYDLFSLRDTELVDRLVAACAIVPEEMRSGIGYAISKAYVKWYSEAQAERYNTRGLRIVSVSPGSIDTEMGRLEEAAGAGAMVTDAAVPRWGKAEEMAALFEFCVSDRAGYLTGVDIRSDGGVVASMRERARVARAASAS